MNKNSKFRFSPYYVLTHYFADFRLHYFGWAIQNFAWILLDGTNHDIELTGIYNWCNNDGVEDITELRGGCE